MECNRDEAIRAKLIAERKIEKKDFTGAKKFVMKAQVLNPDLDGILQLLKTIDVYISAENKVNGEVDWYGVLEASPSADEETIRKQYRKLAHVLHPDKNKSVGADGAFKLISEAWNLLSDKAARLAYNQRRDHKGFHQKVHMHASVPSTAPMTNGMFNFANRTTSVPKPSSHHMKPAVNPSHKSSLSQQRTDTFWTVCLQCKMNYEYLRVYLNQTLLCPNCRGPFKASETPAPHNLPRPPNQVPQKQHHSNSGYPAGRNAYSEGKNASTSQKSVPGQAGSLSVRFTAQQQDPVSRETTIGRDPSVAAKASNVVQQAHDNYKRAYTESFSAVGLEAGIKKQKLDGECGQYGMDYDNSQGNGVFGNTSGIGSGSRLHSYAGAFRQANRIRDLNVTEIRNMLMRKGLSEIRDKLKAFSESSNKVGGKTKRSKKVNLGSTEMSSNSSDQSGSGQADNTSKEHSSAAAMNVPDADFHDFDMDRTEDSFGDNEVWAGYDDDDGMPRVYALVSKVVSRKPFKLRISWLNSKSSDEFGSNLDWIGSGFYKTCGEFRVSRYETFKKINAFSQKVHFVKNARGSILIYPQKDDVWALYKNWSSDWNEETPDDIIHKYEMVIVVEDYDPDKGVVVAHLEKVDGFRTVYRPNREEHMIKRIPTEEMFRFSHRVPYHLLTGLEGQNAPKGFLELDTAATPIELIQTDRTGGSNEATERV